MNPLRPEEMQILEEYEAKAIPMLQEIFQGFLRGLEQREDFYLKGMPTGCTNIFTQLVNITRKNIKNSAPDRLGGWTNQIAVTLNDSWKFVNENSVTITQIMNKILTSTGDGDSVTGRIGSIIDYYGDDLTKLPAHDQAFVKAAAQLQLFKQEWTDNGKYKLVFSAASKFLLLMEEEERQRRIAEKAHKSVLMQSLLNQALPTVAPVPPALPTPPALQTPCIDTPSPEIVAEDKQSEEWAEQIQKNDSLKQRFMRPDHLERAR